MALPVRAKRKVSTDHLVGGYSEKIFSFPSNFELRPDFLECRDGREHGKERKRVVCEPIGEFYMALLLFLLSRPGCQGVSEKARRGASRGLVGMALEGLEKDGLAAF